MWDHFAMQIVPYDLPTYLPLTMRFGLASDMGILLTAQVLGRAR